MASCCCSWPSAAGFILVNRQGRAWWWSLLVIAPGLAGLGLVRSLVEMYPFWKMESSLRGGIAFLAGVVLSRGVLAPRSASPAAAG